MEDLELAASAIKQGRLIAYPTESVFGLGCDPLCKTAVQKIIAIKGRDAGKGLILIANDQQQLAPFMATPAESWQAQFNEHWPGPVTFVVPVNKDLDTAVRRLLTGDHETIAVRVSDHPIVKQLCRRCGSALVSTSANRSGQPALRQASEVEREFGNELGVVVDAPVGGLANPSRIIDVKDGTVLR